MLIRNSTGDALRRAGHVEYRLFAAGCAEVLAQVFTAIRVTDPSRQSDVDTFVSALQALWNLKVDTAPLVGVPQSLEGFPEMNPGDGGHVSIADIYSFYSVLTLRYAVLCASQRRADYAISAGHAVLTAVGQLEQNMAALGLMDAEHERQARSLELASVGDSTTIRQEASERSQIVLEIVLARL